MKNCQNDARFHKLGIFKEVKAIMKSIAYNDDRVEDVWMAQKSIEM